MSTLELLQLQNNCSNTFFNKGEEVTNENDEDSGELPEDFSIWKILGRRK